jgi:hypothetical protein
MTAAEYALKWWSSQLNRSPPPTTRPPVVEVTVAAGRTESALEVVLASGVRVAVTVGFDEATLVRLSTVLEAR